MDIVRCTWCTGSSYGTHCIICMQIYNLLARYAFLSIPMIEQDEGLEALSGIIQRQKLMGQAISDEVDTHNG